MARVQYSALMSDLRGKLNGSVGTRNKGGAALRTKVTPINPKTTHQSLQRAYTSDVSKAWSNILTDAQRQGWQKYGELIGARNIFGNNMILSGIACYQRINRIILAAGGTRIDNAPANADVPSILSLTLTANHVGPVLSLAFSPSPLVGSQALYLFASPALSPGITNISAKLRLFTTIPTAATPVDILSAWTSRFGSFPTLAGQRIGVVAHIVDLSTGAISAGTGASTLVI